MHASPLIPKPCHLKKIVFTILTNIKMAVIQVCVTVWQVQSSCNRLFGWICHHHGSTCEVTGYTAGRIQHSPGMGPPYNHHSHLQARETQSIAEILQAAGWGTPRWGDETVWGNDVWPRTDCCSDSSPKVQVILDDWWCPPTRWANITPSVRFSFSLFLKTSMSFIPEGSQSRI